jgi:hypothetical protein
MERRRSMGMLAAGHFCGVKEFFSRASGCGANLRMIRQVDSDVVRARGGQPRIPGGRIRVAHLYAQNFTEPHCCRPAWRPVTVR